MTLSYRGEAFSRVKPKNREALKAAEQTGQVKVLLGSQVEEIGADSASIAQEGKRRRIGNDAVIICAGGILPTPLLKEIGVQVETKFGTA